MKTKLSILVIGFIIAVVLIVPCVSAVQDVTGNGAMSGKHFTLNLIGSKTKTQTNDNGNVIFVKLDRSGEKATTTILLQEGEFQVVDSNGTDGTAKFQLPYPFTVIQQDGLVTGDEVACYEIFVRALSPNGKADMMTCVNDVDGDYNAGTAGQYCNTGHVVEIDRDGNGVEKFEKVTSQLTTIDIDSVGTIPIFADTEDGYFWNYDNYGLKHAQLRFYPVAGTECAVNSR